MPRAHPPTKLFPFQAVRFRFKRRNVVRVFQRDVLKKFVMRRAGVRRA